MIKSYLSRSELGAPPLDEAELPALFATFPRDPLLHVISRMSVLFDVHGWMMLARSSSSSVTSHPSMRDQSFADSLSEIPAVSWSEGRPYFPASGSQEHSARRASRKRPWPDLMAFFRFLPRSPTIWTRGY